MLYRFAAACLLALGAAGAWGAGPLVVASTQSSLLALPLQVAAAQGFFQAEGVDVKLLDCNSGPRCLKHVLDGTAQLAATSELPVVFSSFERGDIAIIATMATASRNIRIIGRKSAGATGPAQLAGKRIGVIAGSSSHYYLDAYLLFNGIDPQQAKVKALQPENMVAALGRREVDAIAGYSRHTAPALQLLAADGVVLEDAPIYSETFNLVSVRQVLADAGPELRKLLRAVQRAQRFIAEQPAQAKALAHARTQLSAAVIDDLFPALRYELLLTQSLVSTMEGVARWSLREGHAPAGSKIPNYLDFIDARPLRDAVPAAVRN